MKKIVCFELVESSQAGKYIICPVHKNFFLNNAYGSYSVVEARLLNVSWANYLRICRDVYDAEIIGKGKLYPVAYFTNKVQGALLVNLLNERANMILEERNKCI